MGFRFNQISLRSLWWALLTVKLVLAYIAPLAPDEAYYWVWGHHLQWSYFDHPPMVGWMMTLSQPLAGLGSAIRWPFVLLGHATIFFWLDLLKARVPALHLKWFLLLYSFAPLLGLSVIAATPDVPLLFFWSLSLWITHRLFQKPTLTLYAALGASLGLGFCSKYMIVLFVPSLLLAYATSATRPRLRPLGLVLTFVTGLMTCFPVLYWNAQNEWVSFLFQINHGFSSHNYNILWVLEYVGVQLLLIFPVFIYLAFRAPHWRRDALLLMTAVFPLVFFLISSRKAHVEANWPLIAYPSIYALAFLQPHLSRAARGSIIFFMVLWVGLTVEVLVHFLPGEKGKLKIYEAEKFQVVHLHYNNHTRGKTLVFGSSYQMAAMLSFWNRQDIYKLPGLNRRDSYEDFGRDLKLPDEFVVYLDNGQRLPERWQELGYKMVSEERLSFDYRYAVFQRRP